MKGPLAVQHDESFSEQDGARALFDALPVSASPEEVLRIGRELGQDEIDVACHLGRLLFAGRIEKRQGLISKIDLRSSTETLTD